MADGRTFELPICTATSFTRTSSGRLPCSGSFFIIALTPPIFINVRACASLSRLLVLTHFALDTFILLFNTVFTAFPVIVLGGKDLQRTISSDAF